MAGQVADYLADLWLDQLAVMSTWASLHGSDPRVDDPLDSELAGIGYTRVLVTWETDQRARANRDALHWTNLPVGTIAAVGAFDAPINGHLLFSCVLDSPVPYLTSGGVYTLPAATLVVTIDQVV
jgi:hypothetical protein